MKRGEVWWAQLPQPIGRRPVLLLSRDSMSPARGEITVAYLTSNIRHRDVEVLLTSADGMSRNCVANLDSINTIPKHTLLDASVYCPP
jgi:mRNA interferase MazF